MNLVVQSSQSKEAGYDASKSGNFRRVHLPFDPSEDFHEYRFDYLPEQVTFYADGQKLVSMNGSSMPSSAGHLILQQWSNGNTLWSGGPPASDSTTIVRYVKAYFNSSDQNIEDSWKSSCASGVGEYLCEVGAGGNVTIGVTEPRDQTESRGSSTLPSPENPLAILMALWALLVMDRSVA